LQRFNEFYHYIGASCLNRFALAFLNVFMERHRFVRTSSSFSIVYAHCSGLVMEFSKHRIIFKKGVGGSTNDIYVVVLKDGVSHTIY